MLHTKIKKNQNVIQFLLDFFPLILFFIAFKKSYLFSNFWIFQNKDPVIFASFVLCVSTILSFVLSLLLKIKINKFNLFSSIVVIVFSFFTFIFNNDQFIKIKITIINFSMALAIYIYCMIKKKSVIKIIFAGKIEMPEEKWMILDKRFFYMFLFIGIANEFCWRIFSTNVWVFYKVFIVLPLTFLFFLSQIPYFYKHSNLKEEINKS